MISIGLLPCICGFRIITKFNLSFFNSLLPLGSTALVESWIDKVEGRKIFALAELKSPDGKVTYVTANALFIQLDPQGKK